MLQRADLVRLTATELVALAWPPAGAVEAVSRSCEHEREQDGGGRGGRGSTHAEWTC